MNAESLVAFYLRTIVLWAAAEKNLVGRHDA
jgi:hypothetical protein